MEGVAKRALGGAGGADAAEIAALRAAVAREERIAGALQEVGSALGATLDLDDLLELILGKLTELLEAERSTLYLLDEATGDLVSRIVIGQEVRSIRLKVGHGIAGMVARTGKAIRVSDAYDDARFEPEWDLLTGFRTRSMLAAPLKNHLGRTIGVIQVLNKKTSREFSPADEDILLALGTQAAVAIDNSRLFLSQIQKNRQLLDVKEQLERKLRDLELLFELERATARAASLDDLVLAALSAAGGSCSARGAAMVLAEEGSGDLVVYAIDVDQPEPLHRYGIKSGEGLLASAMAEGTLEIEDASTDPRVREAVEGRLPFGVTNAVIVPLHGPGGALGAVGVFSKRSSRPFTAEDRSLLELVAANVTTAVRLFRASEARQRSERLTAIGRLLSQVIHDFKTPMTVISGYVQLMATTEDSAKRAEYASLVLKQFDVLSGMQREVLEFARGQRTLFIRKVYLHKFFSELRQQLALEVDGRAIELEMDVDTKGVVRFDEARLVRAIHNLARNAIEAMSERGGRLTVSGRIEGDELVIVVADTGPGIPREVEGRIFQSFVTAGKASGTGLGLAIVKKIVDEHAGRISVQSSSEGARFEIRLPKDGGASVAPRAPATPPPRKALPAGPRAPSKSARRRRPERPKAGAEGGSG
jgi:signal transduction histidine kinase/putative methionine-R-sulfoxide reductase with GAF domain